MGFGAGPALKVPFLGARAGSAAFSVLLVALAFTPLRATARLCRLWLRPGSAAFGALLAGLRGLGQPLSASSLPPLPSRPDGLQRGFAAWGRPLPTGGQGRLRLPRRSALPPPGITSSDGAEDLRERGDTPLPSHREGAGLRPLRFGSPDSASPRKWAIQSVGPPPGPPPWTRGCAPEQRQRPPDSASPRKWASPGASVPRPGGSPGLARPA